MTLHSTFNELGIPDTLLQTLTELGYQKPSPVQQQSIPFLIARRDLIAQAQTGTGKTAAFSLPILTHLSLQHTNPQALILVPTRELALQIADSFKRYAKSMENFRVLPLYGGQEYSVQLKALKQGAHVIVGTPGRVMDHLRRGTLKTHSLTTLVLDEADEMLNIGFLEAVQWILEQIQHEHQTALFSATLPDSIRKIAKQFLKNPAKVQVEPSTATVNAIQQHYMLVDKKNKLEALSRYLAVEDIEAALIFTGTKVYSTEISEALIAQGYSAAALNGDMGQSLREQAILKLKKRSLNIIVATEVAARGLDVERISHVINFDIPQTAESYIHRIGRTGRAGRTGKALLLVTPKEQRLLTSIQHSVHFPIQPMKPPSLEQVRCQRLQKFKKEILETLATVDIHPYRERITAIAEESQYSKLDIAAAISYLSEHNRQFSLEKSPNETEEIELKTFSQQRHKKAQYSRRKREQGAKNKKRTPSLSKLGETTPAVPRKKNKLSKYKKERN